MAEVTTARAPEEPALPGLVHAAPAPVQGAILVVEDRADVRQGLAQLLELNGYLVCEAATGLEALAHLRTEPSGIALILLDLLLPGELSGRDVRAWQLADPTLAGIPTIIASACEPDSLGREQLKPAAWLEKPFRFEQLLDIVHQYVAPQPSLME